MEPATVAAVIERIGAALDADSGAGNHAGGQPYLGRSRPLRRVPSRRGQPRVARHPGAGRHLAEVPGTCPPARRKRWGHRAGGPAFRPLLVRPDLCPSRTARSREWEAELRRALDHAVGHLSVYQLTIEEGHAVHHTTAQQGRLRHSRRRVGRRPLRGHSGLAGNRRPAGLRDLQPRSSGRGVAP